MFDKFGEFDSAEEINRAACAQREEGDEEAVYLLAEENGIDRIEAEDFVRGHTNELTNPVLAAIGKLEIEEQDLKLGGVLTDWTEELKIRCLLNEVFARAVRKKGKDLAGFLALTAETGYQNRTVVDKRIVDKTKQVKKIVGSHDFSIGIPTKKERRELACKYYQEGQG